MKNTILSSNEEKKCTQKILKKDMPQEYSYFWKRVVKYLNWEVDENYIKNEVRDLLIDMEIATSPASLEEIVQAQKETKFMLDLLWI